ncbi:hypothetical protein ACET3Z_017432 [Daucus carota]
MAWYEKVQAVSFSKQRLVRTSSVIMTPDVGITIKKFEKSTGYSPTVKEAMHVTSSNHDDDTKEDTSSTFSERFRNSKRKLVARVRLMAGVDLKVTKKDHGNN